MERMERICPQCGTVNPYAQAQCRRCGLNLQTLPARRSPQWPALRSGAGALVLGATTLLARAGLRFLLNQLEARLSSLSSQAPERQDQVARREDRISRPQQTRSDEDGDYVLRGWRTWSVRRGNDVASGSEQFEWRIKKK